MLAKFLKGRRVSNQTTLRQNTTGFPSELKKSDSEQAILRNVSAMEAELAECSRQINSASPESEALNSQRKAELEEQIQLLKEELLSLQGPSYSNIEKENTQLKERIKELEFELDNLKSHYKEEHNVEMPMDVEENLTESKLKLYRLLLKKFSQQINEASQKTVGEIKSLVSSEDLSVQSIVSQIKPENYSYESTYLETAKKLFDLLTGQITILKPDVEVNYWLNPGEIMREKVADDEDFSVLLCSCLYALGDTNAEVVIAELDNLQTHAFVITKSEGQFILLDPNQKQSFSSFTGSKSDVLSNYNFSGNKIKKFLYKFNHSNYEEFSEPEIENEANF